MKRITSLFNEDSSKFIASLKLSQNSNVNAVGLKPISITPSNIIQKPVPQPPIEIKKQILFGTGDIETINKLKELSNIIAGKKTPPKNIIKKIPTETYTIPRPILDLNPSEFKGSIVVNDVSRPLRDSKKSDLDKVETKEVIDKITEEVKIGENMYHLDEEGIEKPADKLLKKLLKNKKAKKRVPKNIKKRFDRANIIKDEMAPVIPKNIREAIFTL